MNIAVLLSGGIGSRLNLDTPKQYISINDEMIVTTTLGGLLQNALVDVVWIVSYEKWKDIILSEANERYESLTYKIKGFSSPGANRQLSIYNALLDISKIAADEDAILIQDAARPLTHESTITGCLTKIEGHDGALPVLPMKDTIYMSEDGNAISSLLDRNKLFAGQAPEAYRYGKYKKANEALLPDEILKINGAAEPAILAGMDVVMFPGDEGNFKITTDADLRKFKGLFS